MKRLTLTDLCITLSACAPYTLMAPGPNTAGDMKFETSIPWTRFSSYRPGPHTEMWTVDGQALDNILIFKGVPDGETLFRSAAKQNPMPEFKSDMLPQEVMELVQSSLTKFYGEGNILLTLDGLKPAKFLNHGGFRFNMAFSNQRGLNYLGKGVAAIKDGQLYMMLYTGTQIYYFAQYDEEFERIINSASL